MININLRLTFTSDKTGEIFIIDSSFARNNNSLIPFIGVSAVSIIGITPVLNLSIANLSGPVLAKLSLIRNSTSVRIDAGYNNDLKFLFEGIILLFPKTQSSDNQWIWNAEVARTRNSLDDIDFTQNFESFRTWDFVINSIFEPAGLTVIIPTTLANQITGVSFSLNVNTFVTLQDFFRARNLVLDYRDGKIFFTDLISDPVIVATINPSQIKPNQYLDFQSGTDAELALASWIPNIISGTYINLKNEASVIIFGTAAGFTGTMLVFQSSFNLTTTDHPVHTLILRPLTT